MVRYHEDGRLKAEFMDSPVEVYEVIDGWIVEDYVKETEYLCPTEAEAIALAASIEDRYIEEW